MNKEVELHMIFQALKGAGYIKEDIIPRTAAYCALADEEADKFMDGYIEIFGQYDALELARSLLTDYLEEENAEALRVLLRRIYEQSGTETPSFYLVLNRDEALFKFCEALADSLRLLLKYDSSAEDDLCGPPPFGCWW